MDHKRETDEEIEANRVIEYYKKYCQNPDLIKYFTGSEASCVEKKVFNIDIHKKVPLKNQQPVISSENVDVQANQVCVNEEQCNSSRTMKSPTPLDIVSEHEDTEEKNNSRSSSVASNKIEWDNGADIGYKNSYQFLSARKSASFPSLLTQNVSVNSRVLPKEAAEKSISENIQELRKMYHQLTFSSETSSCVNKGYTASSESKGQSSSSPQENKNMKISTKSSSSSDSYLHRKIGHPVAYSTPQEESTSKESIPGSSKDVKGSKKHFSESSRESTSKSSTKPGVYSVTPMLALSVKPKRNLNNDELFIPSEKKSIVDQDVISSTEQVNESNLNVIRPEISKKSNHYRKKINLCLTKPISVECISLENKKNVHKDVQTSFSPDKSSKCIQTEEVYLKSVVFDRNIRCSPQTQNIEYIRFGEKTSEGASSKLNPNCKATQTENECSKNRKTKRIPKEVIDEKQTDSTQEKKVPEKKMYSVSSEMSSVNTISQEKESSSENLESEGGCYKSADNTNEFQAEEMLLAEMISLNYSKNLNTDIKRSINILQKLLKSRKYDNSTKKYYIKKIVQKIVDSKYSDDSTSSDLFLPKKKTVEPKSVKETKSESEKPKSSTKLMDNLPWYPVSEPIYSVPKINSKKSLPTNDEKIRDDNNLKPRKSEKKTIASNVPNGNQRFILPVRKDQIKIPEAKVDKIKVPLISPEDIHRSNNSAETTEDLTINHKYARPEKNAKFASKSSSKLMYNPIPQKEYRPISSEGKIGETNWRTAKTLSEKLLENRDLIDFKNGQGDYLLHVVKNERNHQLSWINNEIEHLVKLKELLEKKPERTRPDSKLKDVISSLLKMKENDMKGLPKNFEVFICKCKAPKGKCDRHGRGPKDIRKTQKKTACLTPGYYTIETQLDPDGNLLDLTVFDGSGSKKYNYKSDGVVDDVSISSRNHNTEVKLKPKAGEYPGRIVSEACKECCACGRMFVPPSNDSEMSVCEKCAEDSSARDFSTPSDGYKICKDCGRMFIPPRENPNICICQECYDDKPVSEQRPELQSEICEACGRLFVRREDDSELCLCKRCKKELIQVERLSCRPTPPCNVCRDCGRKFIASVQGPEQCVCDECSEFNRQEEKRCSCQKVSFSNPLEAGACKCFARDPPAEKRADSCSACGRESSQCVCGPKFVPKKPKLIGSKDGENSYARKGSPCSHCIGVQANVPGKSNLSKCSSPRESAKNWESKYCDSECPKSKLSITFDDECSKYCPGEIRKISQLSFSCPGSTQSSTESLQSIPNREQYRSPSQQSAKKETCCKACSKCKTTSESSRKKSPRKASPVNSSRIANRSKLEMGEHRAYSLQAKKSCQCCTCTNCSVQTKRPGDKNARCQCCICENCGTQASLDENGKPRKIIKSKWCVKHTDTKTNKKNSANKSNRTYVECEKKKRRKKDELDCTDESLQSISSGNIICITPTKYKNMNKQKSDSTCQCTASRRRCELEQHKSLQICPSVLKAICKSVNTSAHQERICSPNCPQATPGTSDSFMHIRIPQGVQCSDIEIDYEVKPSAKSFYPQICFFSPTPAPPSPCPPCRQPCQPPPCPPPCRPQTCPPPCRPPPCPPPPCRPCPPPCPPPPCRPCPSFYSPPPRRPPPPPCSPPSCRPCPSFYSPPPCRPCPPPCAPPPCRPCPPPPCPPPCTPPPCRPCPPHCPPLPCRTCPPPCSPPPCRPCPPPPCNSCPPPCSPPPCRPCPSQCRPCPPPCSPPPCRPCPPPPCNPGPPPCSPPSCRPCPSQCRPCPPPCQPCPPLCPPPCPPPPCRPCTPPTRSCSPCPPPCRSCGPCPPPPCRRKTCRPPSCKIFPPCTRNRPPRRSCKPFPLLPRCKTSSRTVCCAPVPCCPSECTPPPSCRPSGCGISDCPFQPEKPPSAPPGCRCKTPPPAPAPAKETLSVLLHVPCKLCGIPPCAAISSMSCPICSKCKRKPPANDSDSLKPKKSRSDSDYPKRNSQNRPKTKSNSPNPNSKSASNSRETSKSICKPCDDDASQDDNSSTAPDDVSLESSPSSSSIPSRSVPPDESRSCESLEYPCKPLKPKMVKVRENSSEASFTCPSKKPVCPAKPPPCPGAGDKPCPSFPPRPCPNGKGREREEDYKMRSSKSERRESQDSSRRRSREERKSIQENDSILFPVSIQSRSPLHEPQDRREHKRSEGSSRDLQTQDEVPSMPSTSPPKSAQTFHGNSKPNVQVYTCSTENQAYPNQDQEFSEERKCTCGPGTCKCCQTATHEEKVIQCPAFRQCTCQTEPKEDANIQCNCKEHAGVSCNCDQDKDSSCKCKRSSSSSSSNSGSDSYMSCICCKKEKILKNLISKIPLCEPCQEVNRTNFYPHNYCDPQHSCICYNLVSRDLLCQFKQTLTELERLDIYQQYCEVLKNCKCCRKCGCKCKLPTKFKNGCAYFLKLEDACPNKHCEDEECDSDFFNCDEEEEENRENYLPEVTVKVPNPRCSCGRTKKNGHEAKKYMSCPSIQNYLCTLKPDFIARAERRRRILKDATTQREENSERRKLNFIEKVNYLNQRQRNDKVSSESKIYKQNGYQTKTYCVFDIELNDSPKRVQPRVFKSFREMKDLTRRRYLHLTEVKSKKKLNREKRLREANRLLANTFTRRLQRSTLRGNVDIPLNVKVVAF